LTTPIRGARLTIRDVRDRGLNQGSLEGALEREMTDSIPRSRRGLVGGLGVSGARPDTSSAAIR